MAGGLTYLKDTILSLFTCFRQSPSSCLAIDDDNGNEDTKFKSITSTFSDELLQQLPEDVVVKHIFDSLDFTTRVRLSAVSCSWRRLSGLTPPPNLDMPWLVLKTDWRSSTLILHNLNLNTTHRLYAGGAVANYLIPGGSHGQYLVLISRTLKGASSMLYNPFTGDCTPLPSWYKAPGCPGREMHLLDVARPSCAPSPSNLGNSCCMVAALDFGGNLYICRPHDSYWIRLGNMEANLDVLFYKGELYCITRGTKVVALPLCADPFIPMDITFNAEYPRVVIEGKGYVRYNIHNDQIAMQFEDCYLVESCGELLVVSQYESEMGCRVLGDRIEGIRFSVERVVEEEGQMVEVDNLGNRMLFVENGCSKSWSGFGQPAFFENNCIYFIWKMKDTKNSCFCLGKFPLSTRGEGGSSFVVLHSNPLPSLLSPVWITPNPSST